MTTIIDCANELARAETLREPIGPLTVRYPNLTLDDAYAIQQHNVNRRLRDGQRIIGHKIGLTAKAMQQLFGVDEPDYGHLFDNMIHDASQPLDLSTLIDPQIEVEPAFVLRKQLSGPQISVEEVMDATDHLRVCFEVIDSRIRDWRIKLQDTVADNGSSAYVILGERKVSPRDLILENAETTLEINSQLAESGNTSEILGHPARGIAWLAQSLSRFGGKLAPGDIVLPGTCTRSRRIAGSCNARGYIAGLADVSITFVNKPYTQQAHPSAGSIQ